MFLWVLRLEDVEYDCASGFVVRATTEEEARALASEQAGDEGPSVWLTDASCEELESRGESGIILRDFNAG